MKLLGFSALVASLAIVLVGAGPAYANHDQVTASLSPVKNGTLLAPSGSATVDCSSDACTVELSVRNREYVRLLHATGGSGFAITLAGTTMSRTIDIAASGQWDLQLQVGLLDDGVPVAHGSAVVVTVLISGDA